ncbi:GGDEF domain-containing protein [Goekera deserti]|uniref:GGDEF domain-containing protein n=1 Tax=Goekera deserti TaxID=2497753 RepID=A0A7K3WKQ8_9ACTN|nr:GGDEF domain-containing protein [Goekera deserti]NDI47283.1 diguanylate cyclase [Goekera deserti]NEL56113.1 GGDEF domain-containing protein [Goekera deserti]
MSHRLQAAHVNGLTIGASTAVVSFWSGPAVLLTIVVAHLVIVVATAVGRSGRCTVEVVAAAAFVAIEADIAVSVLLSGGVSSPLLVLAVIPVLSQCVCFRPQVMWVGAAISVLLIGAAVAGAHGLPALEPAPDWMYLFSYVGLVVSLTLAATLMANVHLGSRDDAAIDALTGLYNRKTLADHFAATVRVASTSQGVVGAIMADVDHFKSVNDTHGHERGDVVLQAVAQRLKGALRAGTPVFRLGGEEFFVLLSASTPGELAGVAERLRACIAADPVAGLPVTVSLGVASSSAGDDLVLADLLQAADRAMYAAKSAGRNCVQTASATDTELPLGVPLPAAG